MIHRERDGDELEETFSVLGSTGNVRFMCFVASRSHLAIGLHRGC